eukprot:864096-Prymnesium_polylepis.1
MGDRLRRAGGVRAGRDPRPGLSSTRWRSRPPRKREPRLPHLVEGQGAHPLPGPAERHGREPGDGRPFRPLPGRDGR